MSIAVGVHTKLQDTVYNKTVHTTPAVTTQASGSTFVVFAIIPVAASFAASTPFTDSKSNTYTQIGSEVNTGNCKTRLYYCQNGSGGSSHTFTVTTVGQTYATVYAIEVTGGATSGILDKSPAGLYDTSSPFTSDVTGTTSQANELLLGFVGTDTPSGTETITWGNSFTQVDADGNSAYVTGGSAKRNVTSAASYQVSITSSVATAAWCWIISLKEATSGTIITPTVGALAAAGVAAVALVAKFITATVGTLAIAGVLASPVQNFNITPSVGSVVASGIAPTLVRGSPITPSTGSLAASGVAPTVIQTKIITPGVGAVALAGIQPSVVVTAAGSNTDITPDAGNICISSASDNFNRASGSIGANWHQTTTDAFWCWNDGVNLVIVPYLSAGYDAGWWTKDSFVSDQYSRITFYSAYNSAAKVGLAVRGSGTSWYAWLGDHSSTDLIRVDSGTPTTLVSGTGVAWIAGHTYELQVKTVGSTVELRIFDNGVQYGSAIVDSSGNRLLSGAPGLATYQSSPCTLDNWFGGQFDNIPTVTITGGTALTPSTGSLALSGIAPSILTPKTVTPSVGALTLAGIQARLDVGITVSKGSLALSGVAPTVLQASFITPSAGSLALAGVAPVIPGAALSPSAGALALSGVAPTVLKTSIITPSAGAVAIAGKSATLVQGIPVSPQSGALVLAGVAPTVLKTSIITPSAGALSLAGVTASPVQNFPKTPTVGSLVASGVAASRLLDVQIVPSSGSILAQGQTPTLVLNDIQTPDTGTLALSAQTPVIVNTGLGPLSPSRILIIPKRSYQTNASERDTLAIPSRHFELSQTERRNVFVPVRPSTHFAKKIQS